MNGWEGIKHFTPDEFACKCGCGKNNISIELVKKLDHIRAALGQPVRITSGCRCVDHNRAVGGVPDSPHLGGYAVDVMIPGSAYRFIFLAMAFRMFKRIGVGDNFIHVDIDPAKAWPVCWVYS